MTISIEEVNHVRERKDISIYKGKNHTLNVRVQDLPVGGLTGATIYFTVKENIDDANSSAAFTLSSGDTDEIEIEVTSGAVTVYFSDDPTDEPAPGQTTFDVSPGTPFSGTSAQLDWSTTNFRLLLKNSDALVPAAFSVVVRG